MAFDNVRREEYEEALEIFVHATETETLELRWKCVAAVKAAEMFMEGKGTSRDIDKAVEFYELALWYMETLEWPADLEVLRNLEHLYKEQRDTDTLNDLRRRYDLVTGSLCMIL